ncbi:MAG: DUF4215 domain-containing protein [Myxococcota bacterium]
MPWLGGDADAAVIPGQVIMREGDTPTGGPSVTNVEHAFVNEAGQVAFVGDFNDGSHFVVIDGAVVFVSTDEAMFTLTLPEDFMSSNGTGAFVYQPDIDGADGIYHSVTRSLAIQGDTALGVMPAAAWISHSSAQLLPDNRIYWVSSYDVDGDGSTDGRALQTSSDSTIGNTTALLQTGDILNDGVSDFTIDTTGVDLDFAYSHNGLHSIYVLNMTGSTASDGFIALNGSIVGTPRENDLNGDGDDWDNFDLVAINNDGNYLFSGDTNGASATDEFIAYNSTIVIREGDTVDGLALATPGSLRFLALNDFNQAAYGWSHGSPSGARESAFFACDASDLAGTSQLLFTTLDDELDVDGDGVGDFLIEDIEGGSPQVSRSLGESYVVYIEADIDDGNEGSNAIIAIPVTCCGNGTLDVGEQCDDANGDDTDLCPGTCQDAVCGDGFVLAGTEDCDDGNADETDACLSTCVPASCGDGFVQAGVEECDDANLDDTDGCLSTCVLATCGDGFVQAGVEECDDANLDDTDDCLSTCEAAGCGDGFVQAGIEECDDGNADDTDDCTSLCEDAECGDGFVQAGVEECDDANLNETDDCLSTCVDATCGDGFVQMGVEGCDDANLDDTDACLSTCISATCGDGFVQAGVEECDDANADDTDDCLSLCTSAACGDGFVQAGVEDCDDANADDTDDCLSTCEAATCGDGFVQAGVEDCDDANADDTDDCLSTCLSATCGDGFLQAGIEECDDGNADDTDDCVMGCVVASCGDGFVQDGVEECDDGDDDDNDGCLNACITAFCGDGVLYDGVEQCDDGNNVDEDECLNACIEASCGDAVVQEGVEECDDGNNIDDDECSNACEMNEVVGTGTDSGDDGTGTDGSDSGVDDTAGSAGSAEGGGTDVGADSSGDSAGDDGGTGTGATDGGGTSVGAVPSEGCSCRTNGNGPWRGPLSGLFLLGLLGLRRRGPRVARP